MFVVAEIEDDVCIAPHLFGKEEEAVEIEISKKYVNQVLKGVGLVVSIRSIDQIEDGFVFQGHGSCFAKVRFTLVCFKPFVGEILSGVVQSSNEKSITVSLEFFDDIIISSDELREPSLFNTGNKMWYWKYESEDQSHDLYYITGQPIRVRVSAVEFSKEQKKDDVLNSPMVVHASVSEDGLGPPNWW